MRMLMNNLDPQVAEAPEELVVYGGIGRAARDWESFDRIVETLKRLKDDETLLVQSGKPVGVFRTHADAPRVLIANSNLVPKWADWAHFHELDRKGLMMYGQMTAGSWIYIGTQGIVQGTYETFAEMGRQHYRRRPQGTLDPDRRARRHGRRPAAGGGDGRRALHRHRVPGEPHRETARDPLSRPPRRHHRRGARDHPRRGGTDLGRPARQCRRDPAGNGQARHPPRRPHRPDFGARSGQRLSADRLDGRAMGGAARARPEGGRARRPRLDGGPCRGDARLSGHGRADLRLWQQYPPGRARRRGEPRLRFPRLRAGLCAPALLPRHRAVPLVRAVRRSRGHLPHRRRR